MVGNQINCMKSFFMGSKNDGNLSGLTAALHNDITSMR